MKTWEQYIYIYKKSVDSTKKYVWEYIMYRWSLHEGIQITYVTPIALVNIKAQRYLNWGEFISHRPHQCQEVALGCQLKQPWPPTAWQRSSQTELQTSSKTVYTGYLGKCTEWRNTQRSKLCHLTCTYLHDVSIDVTWCVNYSVCVFKALAHDVLWVSGMRNRKSLWSGLI